MQRRRRRRAAPRDIFGLATPEARERLAAQRARNDERRRRAIEEATRTPPPPRPMNRGRSRHRTLKTPRSPPVEMEHDEEMSRQTESARSDIEASFEQRDRKRGAVREVTGMQSLEEALEELQREDEDSFKTWLLEEEMPRAKDEADRLSRERGLGPFEMWDDEEVARLYRIREVMEYEARKEENNGFLGCFDISNMTGPYLRALVYLDQHLREYSNSTHIGDGKIITFKEGVRIVLDTRATIKGGLEGKRSIEVLVGPEHNRACLVGGGSPPPDWIASMVMMAHMGWPDQVLKNNLRGDGRADINYQLARFRSEEWSTIEGMVTEHYASMGLADSVHSTEVTRGLEEVLIGTLSEKDAAMLIGKGGRNISDLRTRVKERIGKQWRVRVQKLV